jgi:hypothetical protein
VPELDAEMEQTTNLAKKNLAQFAVSGVNNNYHNWLVGNDK